jgi:ElaB/YqjD/DUF883 family membrane-anchored ribosome-binding protein
MAANQTSNQKNKSGNHRNEGTSPMRRAEPEQDETPSAYGAIGDMAEKASDYVAYGASQTQECIREHSGASVALSLAAGFGVGLLIGRALGSSHPEPPSRRYRSAAENVGRRLMDRIEAMIPDALAEHFGK